MRISELAKATACDVETIRYYEKTGLLEKPSRTSNGYREYQSEHQERLQFIRHCRSLQMGLPEIRVLLQLQSNPEADCSEVDELLERQIERVRGQMATLKSLERQLLALWDRCPEPRSIQKCGILRNLTVAVTEDACACHPMIKPRDTHEAA